MAKQKPIIILAEGESIPLNHLRLSPENVRKIYDTTAIPDMADDIRANGLIQPLAVCKLDEPDGLITHEIIGGGRRFRALELLVKAKELAADAPVPCLPQNRELATQISLAENTQREQLHPLDEFRACADLKAKGMSEEQIAESQRMPLRQVKQRLRMANAAPAILKAFAENKITLATLMTFCTTDNHERQEHVWKQVKNGGMSDYFIKQKLLEDTVSVTDRRVRFLGLAAYEKAGGRVNPDLFEENRVYILDVDLLNQLVQAKLEKAAEKEKAAGWKWFIAAPSITHAETNGFDQLPAINEELTDEQQAHLDALQDEHDQLQDIAADALTKKQTKRLETLAAEIDAIENREPVYAAEDMARAGITVEIGTDGKLYVERGFVKPEDRNEEEAAATTSDTLTVPGAKADDEDTGTTKLPDGLVTDLTRFRTAAFQAALAEKPDVAFVATLHAMASTVFGMMSSDSCLQIRATTDMHPQIEGLKEFAPTKAMADQRKAWMTRLPRDSVKLWEAIEAMPHAEQMQLLAFLAASTINVVVLKHDPRRSQVNHSQVLAKALGYDIRKDWTPTADNFFKRVTKATILAAVKEARGDDVAEMLDNQGLKKVGMAAEAERLSQGTGWLPEPMRTEAAVADDEGNFGDGEPEDEAQLPDFLQGGVADGQEVAASA